MIIFLESKWIFDYTFVIDHTLMTNSTEYSYMTIKNVSNWFNGEYICSATEKIQKNTVKIIYPLMVRSKFF